MPLNLIDDLGVLEKTEQKPSKVTKFNLEDDLGVLQPKQPVLEEAIAPTEQPITEEITPEPIQPIEQPEIVEPETLRPPTITHPVGRVLEEVRGLAEAVPSAVAGMGAWLASFPVATGEAIGQLIGQGKLDFKEIKRVKDEFQEDVGKVTEFLTPKTVTGQKYLEGIAYPFQKYGEVVDLAGEWWADKAGGTPEEKENVKAFVSLFGDVALLAVPKMIGKVKAGEFKRVLPKELPEFTPNTVREGFTGAPKAMLETRIEEGISRGLSEDIATTQAIGALEQTSAGKMQLRTVTEGYKKELKVVREEVQKKLEKEAKEFEERQAKAIEKAEAEKVKAVEKEKPLARIREKIEERIETEKRPKFELIEKEMGFTPEEIRELSPQRFESVFQKAKEHKKFREVLEVKPGVTEPKAEATIADIKDIDNTFGLNKTTIEAMTKAYKEGNPIILNRPIAVRRVPEGFTVIEGLHRAIAAKKAGVEPPIVILTEREVAGLNAPQVEALAKKKSKPKVVPISELGLGESVEAISRVKGDKLKRRKMVMVDTRTGVERPLIGVDAIDIQPQPFEAKGYRYSSGEFESIALGVKADISKVEPFKLTTEEGRVAGEGKGAIQKGIFEKEAFVEKITEKEIKEKIPITEKKFEPEKDTLTTWVMKKGGINYQREHLKGELRRIAEQGKGRFLVSKTGKGKTLDQLVEAAKEDGFLREGGSIREFLEILETDLTAKTIGRKVYSVQKADYFPEISAIADIGGYSNVPSVMELPEIVSFAKDITQGRYPSVKRKLRAFKGEALGVFKPKKGKIELKADIFADPIQASKILAHEIGHAVDWLPEKTLTRGNILGRVASLKKHLEGTYEGLAKNTEIRNELKALTQVWKPFDIKAGIKFTKYRHSSKELYADAVSVLVNSPELLKKTAPKFYDGFFSYLERKPIVKELYERIQDDIKSGVVAKKRVENLRQMFRRGDDAYAKSVMTTEKISDGIKRDLIDANWALLKRVKQVGERNIPAGENPRYKVENMTYSGSEIEGYVVDVYNNIYNKLRQHNLSVDDFGEYLYHRRVINERKELANPQGWTPKLSEKRVSELKSTLNPAQFKALEETHKAYWKIRQESVVDKIKDAKLYDEELMNKISDGENYATFDVIKYIEQRYGRMPSAHIYEQIGTLNEIANPFAATLMKDIAMIKSTNRQIASKSVVDFLQERFSNEITKADTRWNGRFQEYIKPRDPNKGLMLYLEEGKLNGFYVDKYIADSFKSNPIEGMLVSKILRVTAQPFRTVFVEANPGFWLFNIYRDYFRAATNLPKAKISTFLPYWFKGIKPAFKSVYGIPDAVTQKMLKGDMLLSIADYRGTRPEHLQVERLLKRYSMSPPDWNNKLIRPFGKMFNWWTNIGRGFERTTKVGSYKYLKEKFPDMTPEETAHIVRVHGGSPDFLRKGRAYPIYNNILLFSNAIKEGYRGDYAALSRSKSEFMWKKAKYSYIPKLIMKGASLGVLGATIQQIMDGASEYDKTNYTIVPLGLTPEGKSVYLRVPQDETGRFMGGIFWKMLNHDKPRQLTNLLDYMAGQAPTLHPLVDMAMGAVQYASGLNPYDHFKGRYAIPEQVFEAKDWRTHEAFAKWITQKSGANIVYKFKYDDIDRVKTELEKVTGYPFLSNIVGRFIRVTDYGTREELREAKQEIRMLNTRDILDAKEAIVKIVNNEELTSKDIEALAKKPGIIDRNLLIMMSKKYGLLYFEEFLSATSNKEKAEIIKRMLEAKPKEK